MQARSQGGKWGQFPPNSKSCAKIFLFTEAFDI